MAKKTLFQALDELNLHDTEHGTKFVKLCPDIISMDDTKKGMRVTMGVPTGELSIHKSMQGKQRVVLMIIDGDELDKIMKL